MNSLSRIIEEWKEAPDQSIRIVAFGSSNTEQYWRNEGRYVWVDWLCVNLRQNIGRHVAVINQGIGGNSTENLLSRLDRDVLSISPRMAIVTIGGNDAFKNFTYEQYSRNLKEICYRLLEGNIQPVLQTYYCPCYGELSPVFKIAFEGFVEANRRLAQEMNLPLIDQYKYFEPFYRNEPIEYKKMMCDRMHLNYYGQLVMGIVVTRSFGLPDPVIPEDIKEVIQKLMDKIDDFMKEEDQC